MTGADGIGAAVELKTKVRVVDDAKDGSELARDYPFACLTYHRIGEGGGQYTLREQQLRAHLAFLKTEGYVVEGFEELEARLRLGLRVAPRYVVLTFDDGHESLMAAADVLAGCCCQATFFITRDMSLNRSGFIRERQIRELRSRGFSLGTHGTTHRGLTFMPEGRCVEELKESKEWLEDVTGERIRYMAAPGGFINRRILKLAHEHGYVLAGTSREWMNSPRTMTLPGEINRFNLRRHFSMATFRRILDGSPGFYFWRQIRAAALLVPKQLLCT